MTRASLLTALTLALATLPLRAQAPAEAPVAGEDTAALARLDEDVRYLASRELGGRQAGSAGGGEAALYLARRFNELGLRGPIGCAVPGCAGGYLQGLDGAEGGARNVVGVVPGTGEGGRYLVVGAHFDHIGQGLFGALDRDRGPAVHRGADDNASGTAVVLELARRFAARPAGRAIVFIGFDAEEYGMVGSSWYVRHSPLAMDSAALMVNLDMVGRMRGDRLYFELYAREQRERMRAELDSLADGMGLRLSATGMIASRSDHASFRAHQVPTLALFTGFHPDYHTARDVPERINLKGLLRVADLAEALLRQEADQP